MSLIPRNDEEWMRVQQMLAAAGAAPTDPANQEASTLRELLLKAQTHGLAVTTKLTEMEGQETALFDLLFQVVPEANDSEGKPLSVVDKLKRALDELLPYKALAESQRELFRKKEAQCDALATKVSDQTAVIFELRQGVEKLITDVTGYDPAWARDLLERTKASDDLAEGMENARLNWNEFIDPLTSYFCQEPGFEVVHDGGPKESFENIRLHHERVKAKLEEMTRDRDQWKASHDNQVELKRQLMDRPDLQDRATSLIKLHQQISTRDFCISLLKAELKYFCDRVEEGSITSSTTYKRFKAALAAVPTDVDNLSAASERVTTYVGLKLRADKDRARAAEYYRLLEEYGVLYNTPPLLTGDEWKEAFNSTWAKTCKVLVEDRPRDLIAWMEEQAKMLATLPSYDEIAKEGEEPNDQPRA